MAIEEFLLNLNQRISVGIPIGPAASIIFAEAVLLDVDEFIRTQAKGTIQYVRYVDDFRLFSDSRCDLEEIQHELTSYLYRAHRLTLAAGKSRLIESDRFKDDLLQPPEEAEQRALEAKVAEFMEGFDEGDYGSWESEAEEVTWDSAPDEAKREAIKALFQEVLSAPTLDIGLARHILRRSRRARVRAILPDVLKNISFLAPVIRDVGLYLEKVLSAKAIEKSMRRFERVVSSDVTKVPLVRYWLCSLFATRNEFAMSSAIRDFVLGSPIDVRSQAIFAKTNGQLSWVKKRKDDWRNLGLWDRTALLMAGEVLASRERGVWMDAVVRNPVDPLDAIVAKHVKSR